MFKRILVPIDGSELAAQALPVALALARPAAGVKAPAASIHLLRSTRGMWLHALPPEVVYGVPYGRYDWLPDGPILEEVRQAARDSLDELVASANAPDINWRQHISDADPAIAIVDYAHEKEIDLIVMSSHGHSGLERWALGSVTERVLRHAPCPVHVVRDVEPVRRILLPLDGSPLAEAVLAPTFAVARQMGAAVTLMHVEDSDQPPGWQMRDLDMVEAGLSDTLRAAVGERATHYLENVRNRYEASGVPIDAVVLDGRPANAILDYAASAGIDLIAMATHGRTGLRRWIYGSVTEKVLRASTCSLLLVRPDWDDAGEE